MFKTRGKTHLRRTGSEHINPAIKSLGASACTHLGLVVPSGTFTNASITCNKTNPSTDTQRMVATKPSARKAFDHEDVIWHALAAQQSSGPKNNTIDFSLLAEYTIWQGARNATVKRR